MKNLVWTLFLICTAMVGYHIHGGIFWTVLDAIFPPIAWAKWLICHEVTVQVLKNTFSFFLAGA